jgi:hypothetical protein
MCCLRSLNEGLLLCRRDGRRYIPQGVSFKDTPAGTTQSVVPISFMRISRHHCLKSPGTLRHAVRYAVTPGKFAIRFHCFPSFIMVLTMSRTVTTGLESFSDNGRAVLSGLVRTSDAFFPFYLSTIVRLPELTATSFNPPLL